jgi:hypothetical protein
MRYIFGLLGLVLALAIASNRTKNSLFLGLG